MGIIWGSILKKIKKDVSFSDIVSNRNCERDVMNDRTLIEYNQIDKDKLPKMEVIVFENGTVEVKFKDKLHLPNKFKNICKFKEAIVKYFFEECNDKVKERFTLGS